MHPDATWSMPPVLRDPAEGHIWKRNPLAPRLAPCEESGSLGKAYDLEPVSGFEPLTVRLQGQSR